MESPSSVNFNPSGLLQRLVIAPMVLPILSYAELEFIKAELALKGHIATPAEGHYKKGVQAAIEMWGGVMPATYFDAAAAKYDGTLDRIMLQKYYALFFTDYQSGSSTAAPACPYCRKRLSCITAAKCPRACIILPR